MKASAKLRREEPEAPLLLRAKVPVAVLGLPIVAAASTGSPVDLSFQLRTALPAGPSLHLSYRPYRQGHPFFLSLRSGLGLWGSPCRSPLVLSAHLSPGAVGTALSFSIRVGFSLGNFSFKPIAVDCSQEPNLAAPKGNGPEGPLQWREEAMTPGEAAEERTVGTAVTVRTMLAVGRKAAVRLRWAVRLPHAGVAAGAGMPFLAMDKISIESLEKEGRRRTEDKQAAGTTVRDEEAIKGLLLWVTRGVEELHREHVLIKESLAELRRTAPASSKDANPAPGRRRRPPTGV